AVRTACCRHAGGYVRGCVDERVVRLCDADRCRQSGPPGPGRAGPAEARPTPSAPAVAGRVTVAGGSDLTVSGTRAYVAAGTAGLQIVDVTTPTAPRVLGTVNTPGNAHAVAVGSAGYAYVADETAVRAVDVSN